MSYQKKSVEMLNKAIAEELTSVHQYMYFHFHLEDKGYKPLADLFHRISIIEMKHVEMLAERVLFLNGDVDMKLAHKIEQIREVDEMLKMGVKLETESIDDYNEWSKEAAANGDAATKKMFDDLVVAEESHQDIFQTELDNLKKYDKHYMALQTVGSTKEALE